MITNERQLQITKAQIDRFSKSLVALEGGSLDQADLHPLVRKAQLDAVRSQLAILQREVEEYETLRSGAQSSFELDSLDQLPEGLIRARIAAGLTQKELADRLGLKEQQVQRYEAQRFAGASFSRIVEIANAIGVRVQKRLEIIRAASLDSLLKRLAGSGMDAGFVKRRLAGDLVGSEDISRLAARIQNIFGWSESELLGTAPLVPTGAGGARLKMPKGRNAKATSAYAAYAQHLAAVCAEAMRSKQRRPIPNDWRTFRSQLVEAYGRVDLQSVISFAWDLGVVVLPLDDPGAFHGACWRIGGVNVVVLKQTTKYPARWLFDILHELYHAGENPQDTEFEIIELPEADDLRRTSASEKNAMWFAGQVALNGRAEELTQRCVQLADNGYLPKFKQAAQRIAAAENVDLSLLANYLAFRLEMSGQNWWGTAANLQLIGAPLSTAREIFFDRFDFSDVRPADLDLLTLALHGGEENGSGS